MSHPTHLHPSAIRRFLFGQPSGALVLMGAAVVALLVANSALGPSYRTLLEAHVGLLSVAH